VLKAAKLRYRTATHDQLTKTFLRPPMRPSFVLLALALVTLTHMGRAQTAYRPSETEIATLPVWAQEMYSPAPNLYRVDSLFKAHHAVHPFRKSYHSQYYKRWRRKALRWAQADGSIAWPSSDLLREMDAEYLMQQSAVRASAWSLVGPVQVLRNDGTPGNDQTNVYSMAQCAAATNILYCGTEPGEVYRTTDMGLTWQNVSIGENFGSGVTAVVVHPTNGNVVLAGGNAGIFRSTNGGQNWDNVLPNSNFGVNELLFHPGNPQIVLAATDKGLYRSENGGTDWSQLYSFRAYDVKCNTADPSIMYLVMNSPSLNLCQFYRSTDSGANWSLITNGWHSSTDPGRNDGGARIAVTPADPDRIYAYLIGESKAGDLGFIGVYRSDNAGLSWTLPNGPAGGPFSTEHPNLAIGWPGWDYHQGFYNCALMASNTDADRILIGGLNLWRSDDAGATFQSVAGYIGGPLNMHVDMQDFRAYPSGYWISTDGGMYMGTDGFFDGQPEFRMYGVHGADYWGFGSGWNEDVLTGGMYHNGNNAYHENYGQGNHLELGGGEAPTGYVNPGKNRRTYYSDIGGRIIPQELTGQIGYFSYGMHPNESYWAAESSEMEFHPNCYNIAFIGRDNALWRTDDGGTTFSMMHTFGSNTEHQVKYIEIASDDPQVMYLNQQPVGSNTGILWKTTDGGQNWTSVPLPSGNSRRMLLAISPENHRDLVIAYPGGSNGNKVFRTINGGQTWTNITSSLLNGTQVQSLARIAGTQGGIYACTDRAVYYRSDVTAQWVLDNAGLPTYFSSNIARPFYRDGKIRIASYGKGIWESALHEPQDRPVARIMADRIVQEVACAADSIRFECHSFLLHQGASWQWTFDGGVPASSSQRNPSVYFAQEGPHEVVLTVTDGNGISDSDTLLVQVDQLPVPTVVSEGFEEQYPPAGWWTGPVQGSGTGAWTLSTDAGGFGQSASSVVFDNYNYDQSGGWDDLRFTVSTMGQSSPRVTFDVAYSRYGGQYSDTLEALVSTDCGSTFQSVYLKGGNALSTAPDLQEFFTPSASQWRRDTLFLDNYGNVPKLMVAFRNRGRWGNAIYLDNINLNGVITSVAQVEEFTPSIHPNPALAGNCVHVQVPASGATVTLLDISGRPVMQQQMAGKDMMELPTSLSPGTYVLQVVSDRRIWNRRLVVR
jgi:photosystem II stability/assembly factor-like uncharacterized protein